ncbi:hypothetical protein GCM10025865_20840 [Paraoerskovia sediminicola]|uniref:Uncharacterized protein n=1 Tax=Paraoerskovia sediminicola TaxID=1138587 RepID=A0ABM8G410_9CELL|nr:hypothetical protein [Paraoerskovia sediminicola]BDZ42785.1 hypothetical protein GCM10025865_20840 [Paraoerskovia sediminicola]
MTAAGAILTSPTVTGLLAAATPAPSPSSDPLRPELSPYDVSPGLIGFLVIFAVALATVVLFLSLTKHLRTARRNDERRRAAGEVPGGGAPDGGAPDRPAPDGGAPDGAEPGGSPDDPTATGADPAAERAAPTDRT